MVKPGYYWVILPYLFIFLGMLLLRSAWGALIGFHISLLPVILPRWRIIFPFLRVPVSMGMFLPVALTGLLAGMGLWLIWPFTGLLIGFSSRLAEIGLSGWVWLPFIVYFGLVNPWLEEAYWRNAFGSPSRYPALVDFLFAGYHIIILSLFVSFFWMIFTFVILVTASWFWRQISRYTGSLLPAVFAHMVADLSLLIVIYGFAV